MQAFELNLQVVHLLLQLLVFGLEPFRDPQVISARSADQGVFADFVSAERAPHVDRLFIDFDDKGHGAGATIRVLNIGANSVIARRYRGFRKVDAARLSIGFHARGEIDP